MNDGMIRKIQKAKEYAQDRDRFRFHRFTLTFKGDHHDHVVSYDGGTWSCDCEYFMKHKVCSHSMALERLLAGMLPEGEVAPAA